MFEPAVMACEGNRLFTKKAIDVLIDVFSQL